MFYVNYFAALFVRSSYTNQYWLARKRSAERKKKTAFNVFRSNLIWRWWHESLVWMQHRIYYKYRRRIYHQRFVTQLTEIWKETNEKMKVWRFVWFLSLLQNQFMRLFRRKIWTTKSTQIWLVFRNFVWHIQSKIVTHGIFVRPLVDVASIFKLMQIARVTILYKRYKASNSRTLTSCNVNIRVRHRTHILYFLLQSQYTCNST